MCDNNEQCNLTSRAQRGNPTLNGDAEGNGNQSSCSQTSRAKRGNPTLTVNPKRQRTIPYFYVYILSSLSGTLYVGLTDNLRQRILEHKLGTYDGFTKRYEVNRLMYFETFRSSTVARARERQVKKYRREKKIALFIKTNPQWKDPSRKILLAA